MTTVMATKTCLFISTNPTPSLQLVVSMVTAIQNAGKIMKCWGWGRRGAREHRALVTLELTSLCWKIDFWTLLLLRWHVWGHALVQDKGIKSMLSSISLVYLHYLVSIAVHSFIRTLTMKEERLQANVVFLVLFFTMGCLQVKFWFKKANWSVSLFKWNCQLTDSYLALVFSPIYSLLTNLYSNI